MATFKNITDGPKGVHVLDGRLLFIEAGTSEDLDVSEAELRSAASTGHFEIDGGPLDHDGDGRKGGSVKRKPETPGKPSEPPTE